MVFFFFFLVFPGGRFIHANLWVKTRLQGESKWRHHIIFVGIKHDLELIPRHLGLNGLRGH